MENKSAESGGFTEGTQIFIRDTVISDYPDIFHLFYLEYGMGYGGDVVYSSAKFEEFINSDHAHSIVAVTADGVLAGHHAIKEWDFLPGIYEGGMAVVNPQIRKCGAFNKMMEANNRYFDEEINKGVMISCATTVHEITQKTRLKYGFTPCGFLTNILPPTTKFNNFDNVCEYGSEALSVHVAEHNTKTIYVPEDARELIDFVCSGEKLTRSVISDKTEIPEENTILQEFYAGSPISGCVISTIGKDYREVLSELAVKLKENNTETYTLYIAIDCPGAAQFYEAARTYGMHLTGYIPNSGIGDLISLSVEMGHPVEYDKIVTYGTFTDILQLIKRLN